MVDIRSSSVDLLFSGQNIEHLSPMDVGGFLAEANRVLRPGGTLCIDSPNRPVTQPGGYIQPEHVLEFTVSEAFDLTEAAWFRVEAVHGIWRCADQSLRRVAVTAIDESWERRLEEARSSPLDSFIWWIVATKIGSPSVELQREVDRIFIRHFPSFTRTRLASQTGALVDASGTEAILEVKAEESGLIFDGPYVPLVPGEYFAEFLFRPKAPHGKLVFDVVSAVGKEIHALREMTLEAGGEWTSVRLPFALSNYTTGVETRAFTERANSLVRIGAQILRVR